MVSEQAVDGSSPLDTMIQRLQQEQDQRLGTNETRASRGKTAFEQEGQTIVPLCVFVLVSNCMGVARTFLWVIEMKQKYRIPLKVVAFVHCKLILYLFYLLFFIGKQQRALSPNL